MVGKPAPRFTAEAYVDGRFETVSLDDYEGRWLVLFTYPADFTFVCPTELVAFAEAEAELEALGADVAALSVDSVHAHKAWRERDLNEVRYPMLADPTREISRAYGVLDEEKAVALRGTFIIDPDGVVQYAMIANDQLGRSTDEVLRALAALQTGGLCPANWRPGEATLTAA